MVAGLYQALRRICQHGPVEMPISEIADLLPAVKNGMAVGSALYLLERAGFISRAYRQGSRTYTTDLVQPVREFGALEIDFERLEQKRQRDLAKLQRMIGYADHEGCRHRYILDYFGDLDSGEGCSVCDNCLAHSSTVARPPTEEETVSIQKALSCVARVNGRFGRGRIVQALVGSRSKDVLDAGLDRLTTYGLLKDLGTDYTWALVNCLIRGGCLEVSDGQYPTLSLSALGWEVMQGRQQRSLTLPNPPAKRKSPQSSGRSRSGSSRRRAEPGQEGLPSDFDARVFEALRAWRQETAARMGGLPAYLVYPDRTLEALASVKPRTVEELQEVKGIGPAKVRKFGRETIDVIRQAG